MRYALILLLSCISTSSFGAKSASSSVSSSNNFSTPNIQDVACANGSYVQDLMYLPGRQQNAIQLTCKQIISPSGSAPSANFTQSLCQACIPAPRGARLLNPSQSNAQGQCVYQESVGAAC